MDVVSVVEDRSKRFVAFLKAVRVADRLPAVSVDSLLPEATSDGLNPTPVTMVRLLTALKEVIPIKKEDSTILSHRGKNFN